MLGRTGLDRVSVVAYGGLTLFHGTQEEGTASLRRAFDQAVNYFDVAPAYGNGDAEVKMGIGLQGLPRDSLRTWPTRPRSATPRVRAKSWSGRWSGSRPTTSMCTSSTASSAPPRWTQVCGPGGALEVGAESPRRGQGARHRFLCPHHRGRAAPPWTLFAFDTVMFPINHRGVLQPRLRAGRARRGRQQQGVPVLAIKAMSAGRLAGQDVKKERNWWYRALETQPEIDLAYRWVLSHAPGGDGLRALLDGPAGSSAIAAGHAYRPATAADEARMVQAMARDTGTLFKREEDSLARGNFETGFYADYDHGHIAPALA
jgi:hypothetical protein